SCQQIDTQLLGVDDNVATSTVITLGVLGDQLLDTSLCHGEEALFIALLDGHFFFECLSEQRFQIRQERGRLSFAALRVSRLTWLELMFLWRPAGADLVLLIDRI